MKEIIENQRLAEVIITQLKDSRWNEWSKLEYAFRTQGGVKITIYYLGKYVDGVVKFVNDFKFK